MREIEIRKLQKKIAVRDAIIRSLLSSLDGILEIYKIKRSA